MIESDLKSFSEVFYFSSFNFDFHRRSVRKKCKLLNLFASSFQHNCDHSHDLALRDLTVHDTKYDL